MNFKAFFNEARNYAVAQKASGGYEVTGPYNKVWPISIDKGNLILPPELEPVRDKIVAAYFHRDIFKPFHQMPTRKSLPPANDDSSVDLGKLYQGGSSAFSTPKDQGTVNYTP